MAMETKGMEIVVGSYEEVLTGLHLVRRDDGYQLQETFIDNSNRGSVKCVAVLHNRIVASGGVDDIIHVYDLQKREPVRMLTAHSGSVTNLQFFRKSDLFSTSEDGTMCVWRLADWEPRTFRGHKGAVNCVGVHPSGKLALTVGGDKSMRTWNLVDGRPAFTSNIKKVAELVVWSPGGTSFVVSCGKSIDVYSAETAKVTRTINAEQKVNCLVYVSDSVIVYSGEGQMQQSGRKNACLCFVSVADGKELCSVETQSVRLRGLAASPSYDDPESGELWLTSAASDGVVSVYSVTVDETNISTELMASKTLSVRPTCVACTQPVSQKRKRENDGDLSPESSPKAKRMKAKDKKKKTKKQKEGNEVAKSSPKKSKKMKNKVSSPVKMKKKKFVKFQ